MAFIMPTQHSRTAVSQAQQFMAGPYTGSDASSGTILAIAGAGFGVIAGDVRRGDGFNSVATKFVPTVFRLTDKAVLATNGFAADGNIFIKKVRQRLEWYRHAHAKDMSLHAIARLIQSMLYQRRFCPFYVYNILGGIEDDGSGATYTFDPVGSFVREANRAAGAASAVVQPFLDGQLYPRNQPPSPGSTQPTGLPLPRVVSLVVDAFKTAMDRRLEVGDGLEIYVVVAKGGSLQGLDTVPGLGVTELTAIPGGERIFVVRRNLKRD